MLLVPCSSRHRKYSTVTNCLHGVCSVCFFGISTTIAKRLWYAFPRTSCIITKGCLLQNYSVYITYDVAAWCTKNDVGIHLLLTMIRKKLQINKLKQNGECIKVNFKLFCQYFFESVSFLFFLEMYILTDIKADGQQYFK